MTCEIDNQIALLQKTLEGRCENVIIYYNYNAFYILSALNSTLLELIAPRRPLKPRRRERKKITQNMNISGANIVVRVVRAFNVPVRSKELKSRPGYCHNTGITLSLPNRDMFALDFTEHTPKESDILEDAREMVLGCQVYFY